MCRCRSTGRCRHGQCIPPLFLVAPPPVPVLLLTVPSDVFGEAITPLPRRRVAEPELLLRSVGGVRAHTADIGRMLHAALDAAPSLIVALHLAAPELKGALDRRRCCAGGVPDPPRLVPPLPASCKSPRCCR